MGNIAPTNCPLAADNGCFNDPASYSDDKFFRFLDERMLRVSTLFAVAPDVLKSHAETIRRSLPIMPQIRRLGFKVAFVAQDGWEDETTPWDEFDVLFVGGSTEFKFRGGRMAVKAAKLRGKKTHMGRVNSLDRLRAAEAIGCDTADGTFLKFGPDTNWPKLKRWLSSLSEQPSLRLEHVQAEETYQTRLSHCRLIEEDPRGSPPAS